MMEQSNNQYTTTTCDDCGRQIPADNVVIHQLHACTARARPSTNMTETETETETNSVTVTVSDEQDENFGRRQEAVVPSSASSVSPSSMEMEMDLDGLDTDIKPPGVSTTATNASRDVIETEHSNDDENVRHSSSMASLSSVDEVEVVDLHSPMEDEVQVISPPTALRSDAIRNSTSEEERMSHTPQRGARRRRQRLEPNVAVVVDLVDSPEVVSTQQQQQQQQQHPQHWACPVCTLHNSQGSNFCAACHTINPTANDRNSATIGSPLSMMLSGGAIGSLMGAAGSFLHGRDPIAGAFEGAVTGAVGGVLGGTLATSSSSRQPHAQQPLAHAELMHETHPMMGNGVAEARSSASISGGYPASMNESPRTRSRVRPRSSFRVEQTQNNDGTATTIVMGSRSSTRIRQRENRNITMGDQMRSFLIHSMMEQRHMGDGYNGLDGDAVENMDYEGLLEEFGDGTENLGASPGQINSLPTQIIENVEKELPESARQCLICLDEFEARQTRKILPCLHGFHGQCCDKWLQTNGSCPICKHRI